MNTRKEINDFRALYLFLTNNFLFSIKITFVFTFISIIYILLTDTYYESRITLYPAGELYESFNLFDQYEGVTDAFGLDLTPESNYYLPDIIVSNSLKRQIIEMQWNNKKYNKQTNLIDYWEINKPSYFDNIRKIFYSDFYNKDISDINNAIEIIDKLIDVDEKNSGLVEVSVLMQEPQMAADIANHISNYVITFVSNQQKTFATKNKTFIEERLNLAKNELSISEKELTFFRKNNQISLDTPDLQLERLQLLRDVEVNQEVFITLRQQFEIAKLEESKERLFINILDPAYISVKKAYPKSFLIVLISTFIGYIITSLCIILYKNIKNSINDI